MTSSSTSTTVSAITRTGRRTASRDWWRLATRARRHRAAASPTARRTGCRADGRDHQREARRARRRRRVRPPMPANQNGTVGRPSSSAASRRKPSRSRLSRVARGARKHLDAVAFGGGDQHVGGDVRGRRRRRNAGVVLVEPGAVSASASAPCSTATTTAAEALERRGASSRPESPEPSSMTVGRLGTSSALGSLIARPPCQTFSPIGCRHSTTARSRPARPNASPGGRSGGSGRWRAGAGSSRSNRRVRT